jgi:hypothetical protein
MLGTQRSHLITLGLGIITLAGCGSYGGGGGGGGAVSSPDPGPAAVSATVAWTEASGPVTSYRVFVSRDDAAFQAEDDVASASATITGVPGERVRIQVAALDKQNMMGPLSPMSEEIVFTDSGATTAAAAAAVASGGIGSAVTRSAEDAAEGDAPLEFAEDGASLLLWEADAPSLALQLTSLSEGSLRTELSFDRPGDDWWVVGAEDFDGDGLTDVLWESATGMVAFSSLAALLETAPVAPLAVVGELSADEAVVSTGDFDGDGRADLLVEDESTGTRTVWLMSGAGDAIIEDLQGLGVAGNSLAASGDFDGDGRADLLWRAADGSLAIHFMDGAIAVAGLDVSVGSAQQALAAADVDGDGDDDLVYREAASGDVGVLLMGGRQEPVPWGRSIAAGPGWDVAEVGDFDGDGAEDLLWASETDFLIGFHGQDDPVAEWVPVDPGADWLLAAFVP